jgi:hypothetical protein
MPAGVNDEQASTLPVEDPHGFAPLDDQGLLLAPRHSARTTTRTGDAFGAVEVGPPVSRLAPGPPAGVVTDLRGETRVPSATGPVAGRPERCPSCAARVRPEQDWCSLCHASLLPGRAPRPEPSPSPSAPRAVPVARISEEEDGQLALDFEQPRPEAPAVDEAEVERMLGALARTDRPGVRGLQSKQAKIAVMLGGGLGLTALLLGGMTALGAVLG